MPHREGYEDHRKRRYHDKGDPGGADPPHRIPAPAACAHSENSTLALVQIT